MEKRHENQIWVAHGETVPESTGEGIVRRILAYDEDVMCVENTFSKGAVGPMHSHPHTQITYVVSGKFLFTVGSETKEVGPGDTLLKQNGIEHGCVCLEAGKLLDIFVPMREDFL